MMHRMVSDLISIGVLVFLVSQYPSGPPHPFLGWGWVGSFKRGSLVMDWTGGGRRKKEEEEEEPVAMLVEPRRRMEQKTGRPQAKTKRLHTTLSSVSPFTMLAVCVPKQTQPQTLVKE